VTADSDVLEIGAGLGSLTFTLANLAKHVTTVELDRNLIPVLQEVLKPFPHVDIIQGDILEIPIEGLPIKPGYFVVANIPYYITSAVIRHLLESSVKPERLLLTVQREVAERICAKPGDLSLLALSVQVYGAPSITGRLPAGAFYPPPSVDSACVRVDIHHEPLIQPDRLIFFKLIKAGFSQKRKTLRNALSAGLALPAEKLRYYWIPLRLTPCGERKHSPLRNGAVSWNFLMAANYSEESCSRLTCEACQRDI
jgi:16S rRNA (adenine1518-N6/adenine1519-N6)-dimethyltransferase